MRDATAQAGKWDSGKCSANANAYAANDGVIGVIGTFNSGCAAIEIPVLNQAPDGGIPMVSPANTYVCLTAAAPSCDSTEPDKYYPSGNRNYLRVVANDAFQGSADAEFAQSQGIKNVYILNDKQAYGLGVATNFRDAAQSLGIKIAGFAAWDSKATSYTSVMDKIKQTGADAVFLGGLIDENGAQLIKDKVAVLGPNTGAVKLLAPDGFTQQSTITRRVRHRTACTRRSRDSRSRKFQGKAREFIAGLQSGPLSGQVIDPYAIYGGQAAQTFLDAIAASDGSRSDVISKLFASDVKDGLLGSFTFSADGDPVASSGATVAITVYKASTKFPPVTTIAPKQSTVDAALGK